METFEIDRVRGELVGPGGEAARSLAADFEGTRAVNGLGSYAGYLVRDAVKCLLVGLDEEADQLLQKATLWLEAAVASDERPRRYVPHRTEGERHTHLALANWLLTGTPDAHNLTLAVAHQERELAAVKEQHLDGALAAAFLVFLDAGDYDRVRHYCELYDAVIPLLVEPSEFGELDNDSTGIGRILAYYRLGLAYTTAEVTTAADSFRRASFAVDLTHGWFDTMARWMKVLDATSPQPPPKEVVRRCLEYLPGRSDRAEGDE